MSACNAADGPTTVHTAPEPPTCETPHDPSVACGARRLAGLADTCELMAATFAYPADGRLAAALADGSYMQDARGCLADAGLCGEGVERGLACVAGFVGQDAEALADRLRKGHSLLFLAPGAEVPVWPHEAAFRFVAQGRPGAPSLFRSPVELDVERHMRQAGVMPEHGRTEPPDSVWNELSFMAYLLAQAALRAPGERGSGDYEAQVWLDRARAMTCEHLVVWLPAFMEKTAEEASSGRHAFGAEYAALAQLGTLAWQALAEGLGSSGEVGWDAPELA